MYELKNVYAICSIAALGGALIGFDISSMSGILGVQAYWEYFGHPNPLAEGAVTAMMPVGSLVGSLLSWHLAWNMSPKWALQYACCLWIFGCTLQAAVPAVSVLYTGRLLAGMGAGIISAVVPVYQAEIAPLHIRGRVISFQQWAITWGILIQYFIQYAAVRLFDGRAGVLNPQVFALRLSFGVQIVPGVLLFAALFFFPQSPRYLAARDLWHTAMQLLADLHGGGDVRHDHVLAEYMEIEEDLRAQRRNGKITFKMLFRKPLRRRIALGMSVQAWSQLCGMNIMMYYVVYIVVGAGLTSPLLIASMQYLINVVFTVPAILFVDKWGRRPTLLVGSLYYGQPNTEETRSHINAQLSWIIEENRPAAVGIVFFSCLFVAAFAATWGPISWIYPAEMFPSGIRSRAVALCTATNWFCNVLVAFSVPRLLNCLALIYTFAAVYETKGYALEEMDDVFASGMPAWKTPPKESRLGQITAEHDLGWPSWWRHFALIASA
ncbi:High-affinity glucose transporter [Trichoderma cornu-damae]|uniref:High-affinity glucose transporter n=1 Tax=Trichoderma cornu-damae TaxID=654480 RepID=A0A9P8TV89_9HYPO|nr:High-affinity glucose transporter [Trichoderma cornu-damae]